MYGKEWSRVNLAGHINVVLINVEPKLLAHNE
jgi:hypothetical protein